VVELLIFSPEYPKFIAPLSGQFAFDFRLLTCRAAPCHAEDAGLGRTKHARSFLAPMGYTYSVLLSGRTAKCGKMPHSCTPAHVPGILLTH